MNIELLKQRLAYDPESGRLSWKTSAFRTLIGKQVGYIGGDGYRRFRLCTGQHWKTARIIWAMHNGPIPEGHEIDHINGEPLDDRIENLRLASSTQNSGNTRRRKDNKSGYKGVSLHFDGRWRARVTAHGKHKHIGLYDTPEEAHAAYVKAAREVFAEFANGG